MGCGLADADRINERRFRPGSIRPLVLLAIDNDEVRARFAYQLAAFGFDVVMTDGAVHLRRENRPAVIVAEVAASPSDRGSSVWTVADGGLLRGIPVVAVADDVSDRTRDLARREGCAAVCRATCSGSALAAGIRAVLGRP